MTYSKLHHKERTFKRQRDIERLNKRQTRNLSELFVLDAIENNSLFEETTTEQRENWLSTI